MPSGVSPMRRENEVAHQACSIVRREGIGQAGRSSGFRPFPADPPSRCRHQWRILLAGVLPMRTVTAAGPRGIFTRFPILPRGSPDPTGAPARLSSEIRLYSTRLRLCCQFPFRSKQQDPPLETLDFPPAIPSMNMTVWNPILICRPSPKRPAGTERCVHS